MKLSYYFYESTYDNKVNRFANADFSGLLLKLTNEQGQSGYANYHALSAFGDPPAKEFLQGFKNDGLTVRHHLILQYLQQDLQNRIHSTDALAGAFQIENHKLITDPLSCDKSKMEELLQNNFRIFKLKMGRDLTKESLWLTRHIEFFKANKILLRLDFNECFKIDEFEKWQKELQLHKQAIIDYYEDPCPYEESAWQKWQLQGLALAKDVRFSTEPILTKGIEVFVLKPALLNIIEWLKKLENPKKYRFVVTHYMDTALGVAQATASALKLKFFVKEGLGVCGLLPANQLPKNLQWDLQTRGPHLLFKDDMGIGFTEELNQIAWTSFDGKLAM
ncbi:MAG: hypothetical protein KDD40_11970 [Bdellovibrionales bacterium]|nr:hypothetical protein [Bdellovibrionales bacterium]